MRKQTLAWGFWLFHLAFCILFVVWPGFHSDANPLWRFLSVYGAYTGASNAYGFFSPAVPSARRLSVRALCGDRSIPVELPLYGESRNRLTTITSLTVYKQIEQAVVGSLGAYAFGKSPCATAVLVEIEYFGVPSLADYRRGDHPRWELLRVYPLARADDLKTSVGAAP